MDSHRQSAPCEAAQVTCQSNASRHPLGVAATAAPSAPVVVTSVAFLRGDHVRHPIVSAEQLGALEALVTHASHRPSELMPPKEDR